MPHKTVEARRAYRRAYQRRRLATDATYAAAQREVRRRYRKRKRLAGYGLDGAGVEVLLRRQGGRCPICDHKFAAADRTSGRAWVVDHDHGSGKVRGLLCRSCNRGLGLLGDTPDRVARAVAYLERAHATSLVSSPLKSRGRSHAPRPRRS